MAGEEAGFEGGGQDRTIEVSGDWETQTVQQGRNQVDEVGGAHRARLDSITEKHQDSVGAEIHIAFDRGFAQ